MSDINKIFLAIEKPKQNFGLLKNCSTLIPCPTTLRKELLKMIDQEIHYAKRKKQAFILLKMNSISDEELIERLYQAAREGVEIKMVIRGISCMFTQNKKFIQPVQAISIVDEYLEHSRIFIFHNNGNERVFISSADWMVRNLDHRVEATCPIFDKNIKKVLKTILHIQLSDNVKARILDNDQDNIYVQEKGKRKIRSQVEIYNYLYQQSVDRTKPVQPAVTQPAVS